MGLNINLTIKTSQRPEEIQGQVSSILQQQTGTSPNIRMSVMGGAKSQPNAIDELQQANKNHNKPWEK